HSYRNAYYMKDIITAEDGQEVHHLVLAEEVSFFNKASIKQALDAIPANSTAIIDCAKSKSISYDVVEIIQDYRSNATLKNITVETVGFVEPLKN
ncbi:MAG: SulP family inorganic anion transporter, partial [Pseudomonadota bacterium]|nr:SulP family inorganic anion transporter [Pseudomonadota bacterium]